MSERNAEEIFNKTEKEMSEMERMMADIMAKNTASPENSEEPVAEIPVPKPPEKKKRVIYPVPEKPSSQPSAGNNPDETETPSVRSTARQTISKNNKSAKKALKNKKLPVAVVLTAFIAVAAVLFGTMIKTIRNSDSENIDNPEGYSNAKTSSGVEFVLPTPEPSSVIEAIENGIEPGSPGNIVIMSGSGTEIDYSQGEHYQVYTDDVSWSEAKANCEHFNGHLVTIKDDEEFEEIKELANLAGVSYVWVGCHRNALGELVWENGETIDIPAEWWAKGEPSKYDFGDNVPEDYILLWKHDGIWEMNDSRNNPVLDYPEMYRGNIAYICEFEES